MEKEPRSKSKYYNAFIKGDFIETLKPEILDKVFENINNQKKNREEAKALVIVLYYTGARPAEALSLRAKDISKEGNNVIIKIRTLKRQDNYRRLMIPIRKKGCNLLWEYSRKVYPELFLFPHYKSEYIRTYMVGKEGSLENPLEVKTTTELSNNLRYWFYKWFEGVIDDKIPPYYLRHNTFSIMMEKGASLSTIQRQKGSARESGVYPYIHMSKDVAKKSTRFLP